MATSHSGAHMDALAHMTVDDDMHWYGGGNADEHLTDFGPVHGDASRMPPFFTRGVLIDAADLPRRRLPAQGLADRRGRDGRDLRGPGRRRSGRGTWSSSGPATWASGPTPSGWRPTRRPAPTSPRRAGSSSAASWRPGTDTETYEVQPAPDPGPTGNPQPVHTALLIENGVYIMESLDLEELARQRVYEFLFVALPVKIRGATGSMVDPVAVI